MAPILITLQPEPGIELVAKVDFGLSDDPVDVRWERCIVDGEEMDPIAFEEREGYDLSDYEDAAIEEAEAQAQADAEVVNGVVD